MYIPFSNIKLHLTEIENVKRALDLGWISGSGEFVDEFQEGLCHITRRNHALATCNGMGALLLALKALDIGPGDEVIVPALTFAAPASAIMLVGAAPVIADISQESWTLDPYSVNELMTEKTKAIIAVDILGHPFNYEAFSAFDVPIIEDAAQAHGSTFLVNDGETVHRIPTGKLGVCSIFSFHANKIVTTGEGGAFLTDSDELQEKARLYSNHGMVPNRIYWHEVAGYNFRMTNLTAAIGCGQLKFWHESISDRDEVGWMYDHALSTLYEEGSIQRMPHAEWARTVTWIYTITLPDRDKVVYELRHKGIDVRPLWPSLTTLPPFKDSVRVPCPIAEEIAATALSLPTWNDMPTEVIRQVADTLVESIRVQGAPV